MFLDKQIKQHKKERKGIDLVKSLIGRHINLIRKKKREEPKMNTQLNPVITENSNEDELSSKMTMHQTFI